MRRDGLHHHGLVRQFDEGTFDERENQLVTSVVRNCKFEIRLQALSYSNVDIGTPCSTAFRATLRRLSS